MQLMHSYDAKSTQTINLNGFLSFAKLYAIKIIEIAIACLTLVNALKNNPDVIYNQIAKIGILEYFFTNNTTPKIEIKEQIIKKQ